MISNKFNVLYLLTLLRNIVSLLRVHFFNGATFASAWQREFRSGIRKRFFEKEELVALAFGIRHSGLVNGSLERRFYIENSRQN